MVWLEHKPTPFGNSHRKSFSPQPHSSFGAPSNPRIFGDASSDPIGFVADWVRVLRSTLGRQTTRDRFERRRVCECRVPHFARRSEKGLARVIVRDLVTQFFWDLDRKHSRKFIGFIHQKFGHPQGKMAHNRPIILIEFNSLQFSYPAYLYMVKALGAGSHSELVAYSAYSPKRKINQVWFEMRKALRFGKFGVYRAMGAEQFLVPKFSARERENAQKSAQTLVAGLSTKKDLERLALEGVLVGDLIYGSYLAMFRKPTINLKDRRLSELLTEYLLLVRFWKTWIENNNVRAVLSSHLVYEMGVPTRVANHLGVEGYFFSDLGNSLTRVTTDNPHAGSEYRRFPEDFGELPDTTRKQALDISSQLFEERFRGDGAFSLNPKAASAYAIEEPADIDYFREDLKPRVLISPHLFWDSPHMYGQALFSDIYEWLFFLGEISRETNYAWYVKPHPDGSDEAEKVLFQPFAAKYPHINFLPRNLNHHEILKAGVDLVLTVHGQIALEYSFHGVPVVNASIFNPHAAYGFSITPRTPEHLKQILMDLKNLQHKTSKEEILEFNFMQTIYYSPNLFFADHAQALSALSSRGSPGALSLWLSQHNQSHHEKLLGAVANFAKSGDLRMSWKHFGLESPERTLL